LPLVSGRFRLCSALPYQILESHLQSLPWLLFAFLAGPFRIRSDPCASAGLVSNSARSGSCPSFSIPCRLRSTRIDATPSQLLAVLVAAGQRGSMSIRLEQIRSEHLRCFSCTCDSKPLTSKPWQFNAACADQYRTCSLPFRSIRHFAVSSLLFVHPVEASRSLCSSLLHRSDPSCAPPFRIKAGRDHSVAIPLDCGQIIAYPLLLLAERFGSHLRSAVAMLYLSSLLHALAGRRC